MYGCPEAAAKQADSSTDTSRVQAFDRPTLPNDLSDRGSVVRHYGVAAPSQAKSAADMIATINRFYTAPRDVQDAFLNVFRQECSSMTTSRIGALLAGAVGTTF